MKKRAASAERRGLSGEERRCEIVRAQRADAPCMDSGDPKSLAAVIGHPIEWPSET